jgi:hypothetical protein
MFGFFASKLARAIHYDDFEKLCAKAQKNKEVCEVLRKAHSIIVSSTANSELIEFAESVKDTYSLEADMHQLADDLKKIADSKDIASSFKEYIAFLSGTFCKPSNHEAFVNQVVRGENSPVAGLVLKAIKLGHILPLGIALSRRYAVVPVLPRGLGAEKRSAGPNLFLVSCAGGAEAEEWELETVGPLAWSTSDARYIYDAVVECVDSDAFKDLARTLMLERFGKEAPHSPLVSVIKNPAVPFMPVIHDPDLNSTGLVTYQILMNFDEKLVDADAALKTEVSEIVDSMTKGTDGAPQYIVLDYEALFGRPKTVDPKRTVGPATEAGEATATAETAESPTKRQRSA